MTMPEVDGMLVDHFHTSHTVSEEVLDVFMAIRGALVTNTTGEAFRTELERRLRLAAFTSTATQAQAGFHQGVLQSPEDPESARRSTRGNQ